MQRISNWLEEDLKLCIILYNILILHFEPKINKMNCFVIVITESYDHF